MSSILKNLSKSFPYGIPADQPDLPFSNIQIPSSDDYNNIATLNQMGFSCTDNDVITEAFFEYAVQCQAPVLDVGAAYGAASIPALQKGATVISNDIEEKHLLILRQKTPEIYWQKLYLNNDRFPNETNFAKNTIGGIIIRKVLHFLKPKEIEMAFEKMKKWLIPGGQVFIITLSPYWPGFKNDFLNIYEKRWQSGISWPGVVHNLKKYCIPSIPPENLPKYLHVMDERPLRNALEKKGFIIHKAILFDDAFNGKPSFCGIIIGLRDHPKSGGSWQA